MSLRDRRIQYETAGLERADLLDDPIEQWHRWYDQASEAGVSEPHAMTVSTIGEDGAPDSRVVLARDVSADGIAFYSNYQSAKSRQVDKVSGVSVVFAWLDLHRQVRVRGFAELGVQAAARQPRRCARHRRSRQHGQGGEQQAHRR